jgi:hypothetical protein
LFFGFIIGLPKLHPGSYYFFPSNPQTGQWWHPQLCYGFWLWSAGFQYIGENNSFGSTLDIGNGWGLANISYSMSTGGIITIVLLFISLSMLFVNICVYKFSLGKHLVYGLCFAHLVVFITILSILLKQYNQLPFFNL